MTRVERHYSPLRAYLLIRQAIFRGHLEPDEMLDERSMMRLTDHSRASVREALRRLASNGVVTRRQRAGTRVGTAPTRVPLNAFDSLIGAGSEVPMISHIDSIRPPLVAGTFDESVQWSEREYLLLHERRRVGSLFLYVPTHVRDPLLADPAVDGPTMAQAFENRHGIPFGSARTGVDSIRSDEDTSELLRTDVGTLLLVIDRSLSGTDGLVREFGLLQLVSGRVRIEA